ncbi:MAG: glycosyltransferase family 4 protein [Pseudomonadota bacterium]
MRVAHLVAHNGLNGVSTSCKTLINAQLRRGHEILIITMPDAWLAKQVFEGQPELVFSHLKTRVGEIRRVGNVLRKWMPDIVHCHGSKANKYGMVFRIVAGAPVVMTAHSRNVQIPPFFFRRVIAPSQQTASFHNRKNLVPWKRLAVVQHLFEPVDPTIVSRTAGRKKLGEFGLNDDDFVIGIVGSIDPRKNQVDGLRIVSELAPDHDNIRLVLIGGLSQTREMTDWHAMMAGAEIAKRVTLIGHRDGALDLIAGFDVLLCTSKIEEGPIVVLEAMSLEVPVVSSNVGMVPELIRDGIDGFTFDVGDIKRAAEAIKSLAANPELRTAIARQGRQRLIEHCDETTILNSIDTIYQRVQTEAGSR